MNERVFLDLPLENGTKFYIQKNYLLPLINELEDFLQDIKDMNNLDFTKKVLFSHELQANNQVEGYGDDISIINDIIKRKTINITDDEKRKRIINLYHGYKFILKYHLVNEKSLKRLYDILSRGLLTEKDINGMGKLYREDLVYILNGSLDLDNSEQGINYENIEELMYSYFKYFNFSCGNKLSSTEEFIRSQVLHFYFVYIHPYFDVNGRTSRTMSMWYLLKKEVYPYIIFNRGIPFHLSNYYASIKNVKITHNITPFILFMLKEVKEELEKEYIVQNIASNTKFKFSGENYQTLLYFLSINGLRTTLDFVSLYNRLNDKKRSLNIYTNMIKPLIDGEVFEVKRYTKTKLTEDVPNMVLDLNKKNINCDISKIKRIIL